MRSLVYYAVPKAVDLLPAPLTWQTTAMTSRWRGCQRLWRMTQAAACHPEPVTSRRRKKRLLVEVVMDMFSYCRTLVCIQMIALITQSVRQDMRYSNSNAHMRSSTKQIQNKRECAISPACAVFLKLVPSMGCWYAGVPTSLVAFEVQQLVNWAVYLKGHLWNVCTHKIP